MNEKQEVRAEAGTKQEISSATETIESTEEKELVSLACPECGKQFTRETEEKCFYAVRAHALPAHKIRLDREDLGLAPKEKEKPERVRGKREVKPRPIREEGEPLVPDVETQLLNFLVTFGLSSRDSSATIEYLRSFGFDNLDKLNHALSDIGVSLSRRRLIIEAWANARDIRIPPQIARSLTIKPLYRPYPPSYGYEYGYEEEPPYGYGGYRRPQRGEQQNVLFTVGKELGEVKAIVKTPQSTPPVTVNPEVEALREEVKGLHTKLAEQEKAAQEKRFENVEKNMEKLAEAQEKMSKGQLGMYDVMGKAVEGLQENTRIIATALSPIARMFGSNIAMKYAQMSRMKPQTPIYNENPEEPQIERLSPEEAEKQQDEYALMFVEGWLRSNGDIENFPVECSVSEMNELIKRAKKRLAGETQPKSKTPDSSIVITEEA